jgi:asparagine synthase (glutamine-hydrolysing)
VCSSDLDFALKIPVGFKLRNIDKMVTLDENEVSKYFNKNNDGKIILRKVMEKYIPEEIHNAVKQGFSAPDASWFKGESIDYVRKVILNRQSRIYDYLDPVSVQKLVNEHLEGKHNHRLAIWSFINFEWFLRRYFP